MVTATDWLLTELSGVEMSTAMYGSSKAKWILGVGAVASLVLLVALMSWLRPAIPKEVSILSGPEGSQSHRWANRYADYVQEHGIRAQVVTTDGAGEVLEEFAHSDGPVVAFLLSGAEREVPGGQAPAGLESLGSLYFQPLWIFVAKYAGITDIADLAGKRIAAGPPESDATATSRAILEAYGLTDQVVTKPFENLEPSEAADALLEGRIDVAFFASDLGDDSIMRPLSADGIEPLSAEHVEAFSRLHPNVGQLLIPEGLFDLEHMIPREDVRVIAPAMNLVAPQDLHPALVDLFLDAARKLHGGRSLLTERGTFPSEDYTSIPMNPDATRYYENGPSGLRKWLPFWLATLVDRLVVYVLPVLLVAWTVFKAIPMLVGLRITVAFGQIYKRLKKIELASDDEAQRTQLLIELDKIEAETTRLRVGPRHLAPYFELRQNIHDMRTRLIEGEPKMTSANSF